ncbi:WXG100 family type VII secretion target [Saccharomonospora xinjiangensis]|uniref:WXG100 family type VII secretion target n=1 Tax=Saccharomonospora xinjiangensis TaxID=75294 RepID=UPI00106F5B5D|nr:hypothetical protein [Saccharomonospora xinjiangensis]
MRDPFRQHEMITRANAEFTPQELDYMRQMLDDEDVSPEVKNNFLYALSNAGRLSEEEIDRYAPQAGADAADVKWGGRDIDENLRNARSALGTARSENIDGDVRRAHESLSGGGFSTSDEIIDQAQSVIRMFEEFYPRYEQARHLVALPVAAETETSGPPTVDGAAFTGEGEGMGKAEYTHSGIDPQSLRNGLDEFRGIDFAAFRADAEMLRAAHGVVADKAEALNAAWKETGDWTGDAKAAAEQVNKNLSTGAETLTDALTAASGGLAAATATQEDAVVAFAEELFRIYGTGTIGGMTVADVDASIEIAARGPQQIAEAKNSFGGSLISSFVEDVQAAVDEAKNALTAFCQGYQQQASSVHAQAKTYVEAINANYGVIVQGLGQALQADPFSGVGEGGDAGQPALPDSGGQPGGVPGGGMPSGGMPGGGMPGGGAPSGGMPGGGAGMPSTENLMPDNAEPAKNPVTGEPLETDPETGKPYPIDPETGDAIKDADAPGTLTVEQGEQKFTMTEPGENGEMSITVEGGDGELGEYRLDFSADEPPNDAPRHGGPDDFGPTGSEESGQQPHRPGPDGKIRIKDGDLQIVAEQPDGPGGPTVVTVDNGKGEPVTYTLGGSESEGQPALGEIDGVPDESDPVSDPRSAAETSRVEGSAGGDGGGSPHRVSPAESGETPDSSGAAGGSAVASSAAPGATADDAAASAGEGAGGVPSNGGESDSSSATHPQAVSGGSGGSSFGGGGAGGDFALGQEPDTTDQSRPSGAGLGVAPGGDAAAGMSHGNGAAASMGGGMGMMGGMGAMGGAGGGQNDDQERTTGAYRIEGNIFEMSGASLRISGVLGDDDEVPVRFTR